MTSGRRAGFSGIIDTYDLFTQRQNGKSKKHTLISVKVLGKSTNTV
ncbi:hypothetical protein GGQ73_002890 [Rhizobium skierniewicense]|uniref:Uncharacterized protein n=1 Tax=Rhizobium skierniewicense TaxID=984260 RepID=A0A7W6G3X4_9HYPH|nr:hypothetical protein [Rhizobium skierniewicense]